MAAALPFAAQAAEPKLALPSVIPGWSRTATVLGDVPASERVDFVIALKGRDDAGLAALASQVSNPDSPSFRQFLTQEQALARFAPTATTVATARTALTALGVTVDNVSPEGRLLSVHAPAAIVRTAFGVTLARVDRNGLPVRVARTEVRVPAALASLVAAVSGLTQNPVHFDHVDPDAVGAFVVGTPCSAYWGELKSKAADAPAYKGSQRPYAPCGYTPGQLRSAYGVNDVHADGTGATVAIVDAFDSTQVPADVTTWSKRHGLPALKPGQYTDKSLPGVSLLPGDPTGLLDPAGWSEEQTLDAEAVHAMAPGANIVYVGAATPFNFALNAALAQVIEGNLADELTNSWGSTSDSPDPSDQFIFDLLMSDAAAKGIGVQFSSGDNGDELEATGTRTADFPATSPMVTAVGGTTLEVSSKGKNLGETYWGTRKAPLVNGAWDIANSTLSGAGGGGESTTYAEPSYQKGTAADGFQNNGSARVVPDVSLVADSTTGINIGQTVTLADGTTKYDESRIGGTSLSCPLFAGLMALAVQANGGRVGFVNPVLYKSPTAFRDPSLGRGLAAVRPDHTISDDPTSPQTLSLRLLGNLSTLKDLPGYDNSTGLGTPKANPLVTAIAAA